MSLFWSNSRIWGDSRHTTPVSAGSGTDTDIEASAVLGLTLTRRRLHVTQP